ncbi:MAG: WbqC family protein [Zoogloea sp.]|nr:WbqC family protein [Zoogloea sp.]
MSRTCVISQPTFLPWLGWFDLADQADVMVILDDVAFSKQSWQQRNRIRTRNGLEFLSVPVKTAGRLGQLIADCELADMPFADKMLRSLQGNYARAPYFSDAFDELAATLKSAAATGRLVELNCALIAWMSARLGLATPMLRASTLTTGGQRGEHVAAICESVGADRYLSPAGAEEYLVEDKAAFDRRGISVWLHVYEHPEYPQRFAPFVPYASALDLIFNAGPAAGDVMRSGRRPARPLGTQSLPFSEGTPA